ncbi:MAG: hypothetical protein H7257_10490 [Taibaiella sp.]|nr:hypothetical protein [Taibaiella sp.]
MKWTLLLLLSVVGAVFGFITLLPLNNFGEQMVWLLCYIICGYFIFRYAEERFFLHGSVLGWFNFITTAVIHFCFYGFYISSHKQFIKLNSELEPGMSPYIALLLIDFAKAVVAVFISGFFAAVMGHGLKKVFKQ